MDLKEWIIESCERYLSGPRTGLARGRKVQIIEVRCKGYREEAVFHIHIVARLPRISSGRSLGGSL